MRIVLTILTGVLLATSPLLSQGEHRLRMAQAYEQGGDLKSAARIYLEAYDGGNKSDQVFSGVVRTMSGLKNWAGLKPIVEERFESQPNSPLSLLLATISVRTGDMASADVWWKKAVELSDAKAKTYAQIGKAQSQLQLQSRAIKSYLNARSETGFEADFSSELGRLYTITGDVRKAAEEILLFHGLENNRRQTVGKLSALMTSDSAEQVVGQVLNGMSSDFPDRARIFVWYYQHIGDWDRALESTIEIDEEYGMQGNEILRFAAAARRAGNYDAALKAYGGLLDGPRRVALSAAYGYARTLEQRLLDNEELDEKEARSIIEQYDGIIEKYSDHPLSAKAMVRCAEMYDRVLGNTDRARDYLTRVTNEWKGTEEAARGAIHLAELYLMEDEREESRELLTNTAQLSNRSTNELRDIARLKLADLLLYEGNLDGARSQYLQLAGNTASIAANDALDKLGLFVLAEEDSAGVQALISALYLLAKRDNMSAARSFESAADQAGSPEIQDRCLYMASKTYHGLGMVAESEAVLEGLLQRVPDTIFGDRALVLAADILVQRGDYDGAIAALTSVLVQYPRSILVPETRERIRRLRGDA